MWRAKVIGELFGFVYASLCAYSIRCLVSVSLRFEYKSFETQQKKKRVTRKVKMSLDSQYSSKRKNHASEDERARSWEKSSMNMSKQGLEIRPVRTREHFLFNLLNFLYFRRADGVRFQMEGGPFSMFVVIPYVAFSEIYFFKQWRYFIVLQHRVVGVLALREEIRTLYISSLAVSPDCRRRGIATYALNHAAIIARKLCKEALELAVLKKNIPAVRLYERRGYRVEEEKRRSFILRKQIMEL
jgi:ribosomal protein S18 acetylase RimI-like enzyme